MPLSARIPKIHLHCHLEGTLRGATFVELAEKRGVPLRYHPAAREQAWVDKPDRPVDRNDPYRFDDFQDFLLAFAAAVRSMSEPGDYARLAREFVEDALAQNVMYGELFISPSVWTFFNRDLDVEQSVAAIAAELRAARPRAEFALIVDLTRNFGEANALKTAQLAARLTEYGVIGIGLGGDETRFPAELFEAPFAFARAQGLRVHAHAGEAAGAESVRNAVEVLGAERIGHGIAALNDASVVEMLATRRIPVEVCPTSNVLTGAALAQGHAFEEFDRAGCVVVVDSDDPAMFKTSIEREYAIVEEAIGSDALVRFVRNAVDGSFASAQTKRALHERVDVELHEIRGTQGAHVGA